MAKERMPKIEFDAFILHGNGVELPITRTVIVPKIDQSFIHYEDLGNESKVVATRDMVENGSKFEIVRDGDARRLVNVDGRVFELGDAAILQFPFPKTIFSLDERPDGKIILAITTAICDHLKDVSHIELRRKQDAAQQI